MFCLGLGLRIGYSFYQLSLGPIRPIIFNANNKYDYYSALVENRNLIGPIKNQISLDVVFTSLVWVRSGQL